MNLFHDNNEKVKKFFYTFVEIWLYHFNNFFLLLKILLKIALIVHLPQLHTIGKAGEQVVQFARIFWSSVPEVWHESQSQKKYKIGSQIMPPNSNSKYLIDKHWKVKSVIVHITHCTVHFTVHVSPLPTLCTLVSIVFYTHTV